MSIAKCKKCRGAIITTEHLTDKKNSLCLDCINKKFAQSRVDGYIICRGCGVAVYPSINGASEHMKICSYKDKEEQN